jgi:hypothetical protein
MASYIELAKQYAEGVLGLLMPVSAHATHISQRGVAVMSYNSVATQARQLLNVSDQVTRAAAVRLTSSNPQVRIEAQLQLLAKALTDLAISQHLLDAAEDEKIGIMPQIASTSRNAAFFEIDSYLKVLVNGFPPNPATRDASAITASDVAAADVNTAKLSLNDALNDALQTVVAQTATQGQAAFRGLLSIGLFNLAKATSIVGTDIAKFLGYGAQASELYRLVNDYVGKAHEAILNLLGRELSSVAVDKAMDFFSDLKDGSLLADLLAKIYEINKTREELCAIVESSGTQLDALTKTCEGLDAMAVQFKGIMEFVGKLLTGLKFVGMIPAAAMPQAQLVMSASHAVLFTYIVLAGADFSDAHRVKMLNRVPGVRELVTANLLSQG